MRSTEGGWRAPNVLGRGHSWMVDPITPRIMFMQIFKCWGITRHLKASIRTSFAFFWDGQNS